MNLIYCGDMLHVGLAANEASTDAETRRNCRECQEIAAEHGGYGPTHDGSRLCRSGSIASGGMRAHCSCDTCF